MADDSPQHNNTLPTPFSPAKRIQGPADEGKVSSEYQSPASGCGEDAGETLGGPRGAGQSRQARIERLKRHRFKKGEVHNPHGYNGYTPVASAMRGALGWPLPVILRKKIEEAIEQRLPRAMTMVEGLTLAEFLEAFGCGIGLQMEYIQEIRRACDALGTLPAERLLDMLLSQGAETTGEDPESLKKAVLRHMLSVALERRDIYNLKMPRLDEMEAEATGRAVKELEAKSEPKT